MSVAGIGRASERLGTSESMRLLVTGGYFDQSGECFVDRVDPVLGTRERVLSFVPPEAHRLETKGFTGAAWFADGSIIVCSFDSVWRFEAPGTSPAGQLHQPDFNDLHAVHVDPESRRIHVCNTGLDAVEVFDLDGVFVGRYAMTPAWFEAARQEGAAISRDDLPSIFRTGWKASERPPLTEAAGGYYGPANKAPFHRRKARDYKHPNHVMDVGGRLLVTLLATREIRCLRTLRTVAQLDAPPHDGVWSDGELWVTTVDGRVHRVTLDTGKPAMAVFDTAATGRVGWCRGLAVGPDWVAVGLTEVRSEPRYRWRDVPFERTETSVLWLERASGRLLARVDLTDRARHSKVFALLEPRGAWA